MHRFCAELGDPFCALSPWDTPWLPGTFFPNPPIGSLSTLLPFVCRGSEPSRCPARRAKQEMREQASERGGIRTNSPTHLRLQEPFLQFLQPERRVLPYTLGPLSLPLPPTATEEHPATGAGPRAARERKEKEIRDSPRFSGSPGSPSSLPSVYKEGGSLGL